MSNPNESMQSGPAGAVQRQIALPMSKAVEIAYKNIRMRLSRSLLVTSGIILALAFLMAIRTNDAMVNGMRLWIDASRAVENPDSVDRPIPESVLAGVRAQIVKNQGEAKRIKAELDALTAKIRPLAAKPPAAPKDAKAVDPIEALGADLKDLQKELGGLPGPNDGLVKAMTASPQVIADMKNWIARRRELKAVEDKLNGPKQLESQLTANGVATTKVEIANSRIQTRWLLGLALLVAFVGILNAMLMSVTERFREIGTMKCLGALDGFIVKLFLIESLFQGIVGTLVGIAVGFLLSFVAVLSDYGTIATRVFPAGEVLLSAALCLLVGVGLTVAGAVYPAWQAARMQPIEAMRADA